MRARITCARSNFAWMVGRERIANLWFVGGRTVRAQYLTRARALSMEMQSTRRKYIVLGIKAATAEIFGCYVRSIPAH
jgi:hypothetical protein